MNQINNVLLCHIKPWGFHVTYDSVLKKYVVTIRRGNKKWAETLLRRNNILNFVVKTAKYLPEMS